MVLKIWGDLYPTTPSLYIVGFTSLAIDLPKDKLKNDHLLRGFFLKEYILYHFGVKYGSLTLPWMELDAHVRCSTCVVVYVGW